MSRRPFGSYSFAMRFLRRGFGVAAGLLLVICLTSASAQASSSPTCFGSVGCSGQSPISTGCDNSSILVQDQSVPGLGDIDLYVSAGCGTAYAVLANLSNANVLTQNPTGNPLIVLYLAEIFYVPVQGGPEQFNTIAWDGNGNDDATTTMVPLNGSVKACAGDPDGSGDPFDEDPQGNNGTVQQPTDSIGQDPLTAGACTSWHSQPQ